MAGTEMHQDAGWKLIPEVAAIVGNASAADMGNAIDEVLKLSGRHLAADRVYLILLSRAERQDACIHEWSAPGVDSICQTFPAESRSSIFQWAGNMASHGTVVSPNTADIGAVAGASIHLPWEGKAKSALACPLQVHSSPIGLICCETMSSERTWSAQDIKALELIANILTSTLSHWQAENALSASEDRLMELQRLARIGHYTFEVAGLRWTSSPVLDVIFGIDQDYDRTFEGWLRIVHPNFREPLAGYFHDQVLGQGQRFDKEYKVIAMATQEEKWVHGLGDLAFDDEGRVTGMFGTIQDITARKEAEQRLLLAASVFSHARDGIAITEADGTIIDVNDAFSRVTGYSRDEAVGERLSILYSGLCDDAIYSTMWRELSTTGNWAGEVWSRHQQGGRYPTIVTISAVCNDQADTQHYVALFTGIAAQKEEELRLTYIAHHDVLTNLPNRMLLDDRLGHLMAQADRCQTTLAVAYLDLDGFKAINDAHGHEAGDQVLRVIAERFQAALRKGDTLARVGGDEFVAVVPILDKAMAIESILSRLLAEGARPINVGELLLSLSVSIGVTFYPQEESVNAERLLRQADEALYQVKIRGKNHYRIYRRHPDRAGSGRRETVEQVRMALQENDLTLYYQPQVNMRTGKIVAVEALVRWKQPDASPRLPGTFLPAIADHGVGIELDRWALRRGVAQLATWHAQDINLPLSVNVGARTLQDPEFEIYMRELIAEHPFLAEGFLQLEVVESTALDDLTLVCQAMHRCRDLGIRFSLDDFGTGYSSLAYLKRLPVDQLKIDRSFVRDMLTDPDDLAILEAILALAATFGLPAVAEGVESAAHGEVLLQLGCELGQGFAIGVPMPAEALPAWVQSWTPSRNWSGTHWVGENAVALLYARAEIRAWSQAMEALSVGVSASPPTSCPEACRFGIWLTGQHEATGEMRATIRTAKQLHEEFHCLGNELLSLNHAGRRDELLKRLDAFRAKQDRLLGAVDILLAECRAAARM